ncbi:MAG: hypothetical protein J6C35_03530 [Bacteroidales bacterium]|nr:hypothetical protein [Bacteroidales bacterium]
MKQYIIVIILALCLASCGQHSKHWETLTQVESFMEERPDSVLAVLQGIEIGDLSSKEEKAKHALLLSMALDKNVIDKTDFEILQPAIDYYQDHGTATDKLRTFYYEGRIYTNLGDYASAIIRFNYALNVGEKSEDIFTKARIHFAQANIYKQLYQIDKYVEENKLAAEYFKSAGLQNSYANCLNRIIHGYILLKDRNNTEFYIQTFKTIFNSISLKRLKDFYAVYLIHIKNNGTKEELLSTLNEYVKNVPEKEWDNLSLAQVYCSLDDYKKSYSYLQNYQLSLDAKQNGRYYAISAQVYQHLNLPDKALNAYRNYVDINDSIDLVTYAKTMQFIEEHHKQELEIFQTKANQNKVILISVITIFILSITCIGMYVRFKMSQKDKEKYRLQCQQIEQERENLTQLLEVQKEKLSEEAKYALVQRLSLLNRFFTVHITNNESSNRKLYQEMDTLIDNRDTFMESTRLSFAATHPRFIQYLESHGLSEWEINYCCLYALGLKGKEVGTYIKMRSHYNVSSDIRKKLDIDEHDTNLGIYIRKLLANS